MKIAPCTGTHPPQVVQVHAPHPLQTRAVTGGPLEVVLLPPVGVLVTTIGVVQPLTTVTNLLVPLPPRDVMPNMVPLQDAPATAVEMGPWAEEEEEEGGVTRTALALGLVAEQATIQGSRVLVLLARLLGVVGTEVLPREVPGVTAPGAQPVVVVVVVEVPGVTALGARPVVPALNLV